MEVAWLSKATQAPDRESRRIDFLLKEVLPPRHNEHDEKPSAAWSLRRVLRVVVLILCDPCLRQADVKLGPHMGRGRGITPRPQLNHRVPAGRCQVKIKQNRDFDLLTLTRNVIDQRAGWHPSLRQTVGARGGKNKPHWLGH